MKEITIDGVVYTLAVKKPPEPRRPINPGDLFAASQGATYLVVPIHDSIDEGVIGNA